MQWLLGLNKVQVVGWGKYDDHITSSQNVMLEMKKLGIELDFPPSKLKTGHGEAVCIVLNSLLNLTLNAVNKKFKKPVFQEEE